MSTVISILNEKTAHDLTRKNYIRHCKKYIAFCRENFNCKFEGWYVTIGTVRQNAIKNNRPIKYNRLAVYMVSLYKNSHFRLNVTVENYLAI